MFVVGVAGGIETARAGREVFLVCKFHIEKVFLVLGPKLVRPNENTNKHDPLG